jgi:uncharacterized membrane protein
MKNRLRLLIVVFLLLGLFFRFVNIDKKFYWYDEVFTSLRISGYTQTEVLREIGNGQIVKAQDLMKYQSPTSEKKIGDTIKSLAIEEPQLPPLYFLAVKYWVQIFGDAPAVTRSFSALISLLVFPCLYWLCRELFVGSEVAWIAMGLVAVSPFHVLYAQEARPYSLWSVMILLSGASLLRAIRLETTLSWGIYALTTILGIYTHLFTGLVALGHGIYVWATADFKWTQRVRDYLAATGVIFLASIPWTAIFIINKRAAVEATHWAYLESSIISLVKNWAGNIGRIFLDFGLTSGSPSIYLMPFTLVNFILLLLLAYAVYCLCRQTHKRISLFVLTMMAMTALAVMIPDVILGGIRSTKARYLLPTYLGIQIAIAYLLATHINAPSARSWKPQAWKFVTVGLLTAGVLSCAVSSQAQSWWSKEFGEQNLQVARTANQAVHPLVAIDISEVSLGNVISLSYLLEPKVRLQLLFFNPKTLSQEQLVALPTIPKTPKDFSDVFVYGRSNLLGVQLAKIQDSKIKLVAQGKNSTLWLGKLVQD